MICRIESDLLALLTPTATIGKQRSAEMLFNANAAVFLHACLFIRRTYMANSHVTFNFLFDPACYDVSCVAEIILHGRQHNPLM